MKIAASKNKPESDLDTSEDSPASHRHHALGLFPLLRSLVSPSSPDSFLSSPHKSAPRVHTSGHEYLSGDGLLICRISPLLDLNFEAKVQIDFTLRYTIPHGMGIREQEHPALNEKFATLRDKIARLSIDALDQNPERHFQTLGTLGNRPHFVEILRTVKGQHFLCIRSDSRSLENAMPESSSLLTEKELRMAKKEWGRANRRLIAEEILGEFSEPLIDSSDHKSTARLFHRIKNNQAELSRLYTQYLDQETTPSDVKSIYFFQVP